MRTTLPTLLFTATCAPDIRGSIAHEVPVWIAGPSRIGVSDRYKAKNQSWKQHSIFRNRLSIPFPPVTA